MLYLFEHNRPFPVEVSRILSNLKNICRTSVSNNSYLDSADFLGLKLKDNSAITTGLFVLWMLVLMEQNDPLGYYLYLELRKNPIFKILSPMQKLYVYKSYKSGTVEPSFYLKDIDPDTGEEYFYPVDESKFHVKFEDDPVQDFSSYNKIIFYREVPRSFEQVLSIVMTIRGLNSEREVLSQLKLNFSEDRINLKFKLLFSSNRKPKEKRRIGVGYRDKGSLRDNSERRNLADTSKEHWLMTQKRKHTDQILKSFKRFFGLGP